MDPIVAAGLQVAAVPMTLIGLAFVATVQAVALELVFETPLYKRLLGKAADGQGVELRPWLSLAVGLGLAFSFNLQAIAYGLAIDPAQLSANGVWLDKVLTGFIIGGGTKAVKKVWKRWDATRDAIAEGAKANAT